VPINHDQAALVFQSGIIGGLLGASGALLSQLLAHRLNRRRELERFAIQSFERFRTELSQDSELRRIGLKHADEPLTEEEMQDYLGFFEEVGLYAERGLVDLELVDEIMGDFVLDCYNDDEMMKFVGGVRGEARDPTYFLYFEKLAQRLKGRRERGVQ
jgi:hypothetical protein